MSDAAGRRGAHRLRPRWPCAVVRVSGASMVPTLRDGDLLLVRRGGRTVRSGDLAVAQYRTMPAHHVVKRVAGRAGDGWWLASDNPFAGGGSDVHGVADVSARVLLRWPPRRR